MKNTSLCYIENEGCRLMLHRVKKVNDENRDKWIGVGGKFEEGESPEDCMLREVREETGLQLNSYSYCGIVTFVSDEYGTEYMHLFKSSDFSGELKECDEGTLEWVPKADTFRLPIWQGDKLFLNLMDSDVPFFSLKLCYRGEALVKAVLNGDVLFSFEN